MKQVPDGFLDGKGGKSSKRLLSVVSLLLAFLTPFIAGLIFKWAKIELPTGVMMGTLLAYSAAMQGVSYLQEKGK